MKAPKFFLNNKTNTSIFSIFILPILRFFSIFYKIGFAINSYFLREKIIKLKQKVICVGNIVCGGSGKTEIVLAILRLLKKSKKKVAILTKGYGRKNHESFFIESGSIIDPYIIGDEPSYLLDESDIFVVKKRSDILNFENLKNYDYIIMDDGLQDFSIYQDFRFIVFDINYFIGNGFLLPAGPMRQNFFKLSDSDFIILTGKGDENVKKLRIDFLKSMNSPAEKIFFTNTKITNIYNLNSKYIAFSGIGHNKKFFNFLSENGFNVVKKIEFKDHHIYSENELKNIIKIAEKDGFLIITTKKDYVKIPSKFKDKITYLEIQLEIEDLDLF